MANQIWVIAAVLLLAGCGWGQAPTPCHNEDKLNALLADAGTGNAIEKLTLRDLRLVKHDALDCQVKRASEGDFRRAYSYAFLVEFALNEEQRRFAIELEHLLREKDKEQS